LKALRDLRDLLARNIEACDSLRDLASLSGRFQSVLEEIAKLEPPKEAGDGIDEIAERRTARRAGSAKGSVRAGGAV
jgi:hypothetical protein